MVLEAPRQLSRRIAGAVVAFLLALCFGWGSLSGESLRCIDGQCVTATTFLGISGKAHPISRRTLNKARISKTIMPASGRSERLSERWWTDEKGRPPERTVHGDFIGYVVEVDGLTLFPRSHHRDAEILQSQIQALRRIGRGSTEAFEYHSPRWTVLNGIGVVLGLAFLLLGIRLTRLSVVQWRSEC